MSQFTTGEAAALCGVTVRTVQYYDQRGIMSPSSLTEGGRRLYSEADIEKLKAIIFLREAGLSIDTIRRLLQEEHPEKVIGLMVAQRQQALREEMDALQQKLRMLDSIAQSAKCDCFTVESIGGMAHTMEDQKKLKKVRTNMLVHGIAIEVLEAAALYMGIRHGHWLPMVVVVPIVIIGVTVITRYYFGNIDYICPECNHVFKPPFWQAFFARHTFKTRKLTCTNCHHKGFCVETYHR